MEKINNIVERETLIRSRRSRINPLYWIETGMKERKTRKQEKMLQMKLAILSGGITRMK
jgi:hypothetical protein